MLDTSKCHKPVKRMKFPGIRSSKFRHVYGSPAKKDKSYENIRITRNAHDSNFCAVNPKFLAVVVEVGGGGSFVVLPLDKTGRLSHSVAKVCGHRRPVQDIKWNPFNDNIIASGSEDCTVKLWYIPDGGLITDLNEHLVELLGHRRRVMILEWHPTAENVLLSAGYDHMIIVWNIAKGQAINYIDCHEDTIYSMSFNRNGSLLATSCKDKKLRIIDPRSAEVLRVGDGHQGTKASKVVYLGDTGMLFSTGFSKFSDRQYAMWSQNDLSQPLKIDNIDSSSGVLVPFYDHDTRMIYVAGKGDGNVRYYEVIDEAPWIHYLSQFISGAPQRAFGVLPKRGCDTSQCEIFRFYKLHATKDVVEPISMIVPRKSEMFQDDIYPETLAPNPSLTAEEWINGKNANPILMSLKSGTKIRTYKPVVYKPGEKGLVSSERNNDRKFVFLSEETKPDYRPIKERVDMKPCPQIDHRPLGADSYAKKQFIDSCPNKSAKTSINLGTKFQDIQRKWTNLPSLPSTPTHNNFTKFDQIYKAVPTSGSASVKSLTSRFDTIDDNNDDGDDFYNNNNNNNNTNALQRTINDQKKEIEFLKTQLHSKDKTILYLEDELRRITLSH